MNYFAVWNPNPDEKNDILSKHKEVYNGYQTLNPAAMEKTQPLYTQDWANDKGGITVNNKGEVKPYTNIGINESVEEGVCEQCGGIMKENVCEQCGDVNEQMYGQDLDKTTDLNPKAGFDYIEGSSNDIDTFEKSNKKLYKEQEGGFDSINILGDSLIQTQDFQDLFSSMDPSDFSDEFEYTDNLIYKMLEPFEEEDFYDDLFDYIKDTYSESFFDAYYVTVGDDIDDENIEDIDYEEVDEQYDAVEPAYDFESDGPEDVYGTLKDYDKEHPHHDYNSMEDVEKYDPSDDLYKMFGLPTDPSSPSDTFQHDAGDVNRRGDAGLGMDTENDMDLGSVESKQNFVSGGPLAGGYFENEDDDDISTDYPIDESVKKETQLIKEMMDRMKKFM
jgi:hypothetical protein